MVVDEPEGDLAQGETDNDSPKTDLLVRSYAGRHMTSCAGTRASAGAPPPNGTPVGGDRLPLTSLDHHAADPGLLAAWLRGRWEIENRVHHIRDVTQRGDASRIRTGNGPRVMAALRTTATNIARLDGHHVAAAQRAAAWHPTAITNASQQHDHAAAGQVSLAIQDFDAPLRPGRGPDGRTG